MSVLFIHFFCCTICHKHFLGFALEPSELENISKSESNSELGLEEKQNELELVQLE